MFRCVSDSLLIVGTFVAQGGGAATVNTWRTVLKPVRNVIPGWVAVSREPVRVNTQGRIAPNG
ncbi:hypothetical protein NUM3379_40200 [Kineococcus sp. NUM-3379]